MNLDWTRIDSGRFEELCHDLVRLFLPPARRTLYQPRSMPNQPDRQKDGILENCEFEKLKPPVFFSFKTSEASRSSAESSKLITNEFLAHKLELIAGRPKSLFEKS